jgi:hypothetical protein
VFWYGERSCANCRDGSIQYYNCCKGGKIYIPPYRPRPEPLASLARFDCDTTSKKLVNNLARWCRILKYLIFM